MKLVINLIDTRGDQCRIVPVHIEGPELVELTKERLWDVYQKMWQSIDESFKKKKP